MVMNRQGRSPQKKAKAERREKREQELREQGVANPRQLSVRDEVKVGSPTGFTGTAGDKKLIRGIPATDPQIEAFNRLRLPEDPARFPEQQIQQPTINVTEDPGQRLDVEPQQSQVEGDQVTFQSKFIDDQGNERIVDIPIDADKARSAAQEEILRDVTTAGFIGTSGPAAFRGAGGIAGRQATEAAEEFTNRLAAEFRFRGSQAFDQEKAIEQVLKGTRDLGGNIAQQAFRREKAIQQLRLIDPSLSDKQAFRLISSYNKWSVQKIKDFLIAKPTKLKFKFSPFKTLGALAGTDVLVSWYALDNVADGLQFTTQHVEKAFTQGTITLEEAEAMFAEAEQLYDLAVAKVNTSARYNPLMFPARKLIMSGVEFKRKNYEITRDRILDIMRNGDVRQRQFDRSRDITNAQQEVESARFGDRQVGTLTSQRALGLR